MTGRLIKRIPALTRMWEWLDKIEIVFAASLILLIYTPEPLSYFKYLGVLGVYGIVLGAYGYTINSYFDRVQDNLAGKRSGAQYFTRRQHFIFLCFLAVPAIVLPMLSDHTNIRLMGIGIFLLATFYSAPPIRLKEKGILGPISSALVQRPLPFLLFSLLVPQEPALTLFLFGWLTFVGLVIMFAHQVLDYENDRKTNVKTWALEVGFSSAKKTTLASLLFLIAYIFSAPLFFLSPEGLTLSMVMIVFSRNAISYTLHAIRLKNKVEDVPG
jgi:4-hydroxybenzoate polyprenyltransferase